MITSDGVEWLGSSHFHPASGSYIQRKLLQHMDGASQHPCLLVVSGIGADWTQKLGGALKLDPRFITRHNGSLDTCTDGSLEIDRLSSDFTRFLQRAAQENMQYATPTR